MKQCHRKHHIAFNEVVAYFPLGGGRSIQLSYRDNRVGMLTTDKRFVMPPPPERSIIFPSAGESP